MERITLFSLVSAIFITSLPAQQIPDGYILQYEQYFSNSKSLGNFCFSNPESWGIFKDKGNYYLQFNGISGYEPRYPSPDNIAILNQHIFGDFVMEFSFMPQPNEWGIFDFSVILGLKDSLKYYYIRLAEKLENESHGIYLIKNSYPVYLNTTGEVPAGWKEQKWHKMRVERDIVRRTIKVFVDNMKQPALQTRDYELILGYVGFGSAGCPGRIDNIRIWAPTVIPENLSIFSTAGK
jgi:hypothetical protein